MLILLIKIIFHFISRINQTEEAKELINRYNILIKNLLGFETTVFDNWVVQVPDQVKTNLNKSLISRNLDNQQLILNFSSQLFAILREVHYLKLMEKNGLPDIGIELSEKSETYRSYTLNLERTIEWYNKVNIHPC